MNDIHNKIITLSLVTASLILSPIFSSLAQASQTSNSFKVSTRITPKCSIIAAAINFGNLSPRTDGILNLRSKIQTVCTKNTSYKISLSTGHSTTMSYRSLRASASDNVAEVQYNLYTDESMTKVLGDGTNNTYILEGVGTGMMQEFDFYGSIKLNQFVKSDDYTDDLFISINY